eukprot:73833_1
MLNSKRIVTRSHFRRGHGVKLTYYTTMLLVFTIMFASRLDCVQGASEENSDDPVANFRATLEEARKTGNTDNAFLTFTDTANIRYGVIHDVDALLVEAVDVLVELWTRDLSKIQEGILEANSPSAFDTLEHALATQAEVYDMIGYLKPIIEGTHKVMKTNVFTNNEKSKKEKFEKCWENARDIEMTLPDILRYRRTPMAIAVKFDKAQKDRQALVDSLDTIQNSENVLNILKGAQSIYGIVDKIKVLRDVGTGGKISPAPSLNTLQESLSEIQDFVVKASTVFCEKMPNEIDQLPHRFSGEKLTKELKAARERILDVKVYLQLCGVSVSDKAYRDLQKVGLSLNKMRDRNIAGKKSSAVYRDRSRTMYLADLKIMLPVVFVVLVVYCLMYKKGCFKNM